MEGQPVVDIVPSAENRAAVFPAENPFLFEGVQILANRDLGDAEALGQLRHIELSRLGEQLQDNCFPFFHAHFNLLSIFGSIITRPGFK